MAPGRDDDALTWDGDDDPTLDVGSNAQAPDEPADESMDAAPPESAETLVLPEGYTALGKGSEQLQPRPADDAGSDGLDAAGSEAAEADRPSMSSAALVGLGVVAGIYLLLSLGWLLGTARFQLVAALFLEPVAFQVTLWLAVLALPLWFATVLWLTRSGRTWVRFVLLAAGAVLLIPWPFVLAGAAL